MSIHNLEVPDIPIIFYGLPEAREIGGAGQIRSWGTIGRGLVGIKMGVSACCLPYLLPFPLVLYLIKDCLIKFAERNGGWECKRNRKNNNRIYKSGLL